MMIIVTINILLVKQLILLYVYMSIGEGGIEPDAVEAGKIFTELAEQGHPFAQVSRDGFPRVLTFFLREPTSCSFNPSVVQGAMQPAQESLSESELVSCLGEEVCQTTSW